MTALPLLLFAACAPHGGDRAVAPHTQTGSGDSGDSGAPEGALEEQFSFVVIADPHVTGPGEHARRLDDAVAWVNTQASTVDFVVVLGDIAWGDGFPTAVTSLSALTVPWVPVMGDNEVQAEDEEAFALAFSDQIALLEDQLDGFEAVTGPVEHPDWGRPAWLQNLTFQHGPVRFVAADWSSRDLDTLWGETPDLHDFPGGTWPWLEDQLQAAQPGLSSSVVLLSHMPLFSGPGGLVVDEAAQVIETFAPHADLIWGNLAGHLHGNSDMVWDEAGIEVHVTDATWDDENMVRVVTVHANERRVAFSHALVEIPPGG